MIIDDKINFKAGGGAPIAQLIAGNIVAETFQFVHQVCLKGLTEFRCAGTKFSLLQDGYDTNVKKIIF